jgi:hypothetical protein
MEYKDIDLSNYQFVSDLPVFARFHLKISSLFWTVLSGIPLSPVVVKDQISKRKTLLVELASVIGYSGENMTEVLSYHQRRYLYWSIVRVIIGTLLGMLMVIILTGAMVTSVIFFADPDDSSETAVITILFLLTILIYAIAFLFAAKVLKLVASALIDRHFSDSICTTNSVYLIIELTRNEVINHPKSRKALQTRINWLARGTLLLPLKYSSQSEVNYNWIKEHFKRMELYTRERERWLAAPIETTLDDMRRDFRNLSDIYIKGDYGRFYWEGALPTVEQVVLTWKQRLTKSLPQLIGLALPFIVLVYAARNPDTFKSIGAYSNIIILIMITWLLLIIDSVLKLGVIERVISVTKQIKELR